MLPDGWYTLVVPDGVRLEGPGLYEWRIEGVGCYIGKFTRLSRPTRHYGRNVTRLLNGQPYRLGNPAGYRRIHRALAEAHGAQRMITLTILENVEASLLNARERELIAERGSLNDPPFLGSPPKVV